MNEKWEVLLHRFVLITKYMTLTKLCILKNLLHQILKGSMLLVVVGPARNIMASRLRYYW
jgi:hypothetical protein